ncbi:MAG TPA: type I-U CRISPR-associated protein Csb2 [Verrucomicrobiae bacterium]|nr:type I-U CRISPR-associated protein Csb2 [Verrucomicrobiae bacterium]
MIAIKITFPAGRWHATAWGTHVNEGVPEWPPCPWRLLRALLAAWFWKDRRDETVLRNLLEKLSSVAPDYLLPEATSAHTRHYMPVVEGKNETKTKIFDTFVHVTEGDALWIRWDVSLAPEESDLLARLLMNFSYLGRAESLVDASLVPVAELPLRNLSEWTRSAEVSSMQDGEPFRILAPQAPSAYAEWLTAHNESAGASKKTKAKKKNITLPESIFDALHLDTADWKKDGWNLPPGSRWIDYIRPRDCFKIAPVSRPRGKPQPNKLPTVARFAIVAKVPPAITQSLSLAERFHQALCAKLKDAPSSALTGVDADGKPLTGNQHAYFLPECDLHGYVTHMTVHAPCGFSVDDSRALSRLRTVWAIEGKGAEIDVVLLATGQPADFNPASPYFRPARVWRSLAPFVPVRHAKATRTGVPKIDPENELQKGSPEHDCLRLFSLVAPDHSKPKVRLLGRRIRYGLRDIPCLDFQRQRRRGGGTRGDHRGYALELEFEQPTTLHFGLGYAAHFGLGLFVPA